MKQKIFLCFLIAAGVLMLSATDGYSFESGDPGCGTVIECGNCHVAGGPGEPAGIFTFCDECPDDPSCTTPTTLPPATTTTTLPPATTTTTLPPATTTTTLPPATTTTTLPPATTTTTLPPATTTTTLPPATTTTTLPPATTTTTLPPATTTTSLPPATTTTTLPSEDLCPEDPNKTEPGVCGCGISDVDSDGDGLEDCIDNAPYNPNPDQTDFDGDGVGDVAETDETFDDPSVASLLVNYGQDRVTVSTDNNSLEDVYTLATDQVGDLPSGVTFPFDLFGFAVTGFGAGNPTTVTINLPDGEAPTTYWKYGPTPLDGTDHWYEFLYDGTTGAELDGNVITLHFVDGERGDHDLTADGIIDDPGGPAFVCTGGGGSSSTCFIATAAYGTSWEPHVMTLRQFRDSHLLTNKLGTKFVEAYYKYSPPMADYIAEHDGLRSIVRIGIAPLVGFSWLAMNYGMMIAFAFLFSMLTMIVGGICFIIKTKETNQ